MEMRDGLAQVRQPQRACGRACSYPGWLVKPCSLLFASESTWIRIKMVIFELGADFHLVKPASLEQLIDDVRSIEALWLSE
jgi:hypothetical protein